MLQWTKVFVLSIPMIFLTGCNFSHIQQQLTSKSEVSSNTTETVSTTKCNDFNTNKKLHPSSGAKISQWKIYTNKTFKYSFNYPEDVAVAAETVSAGDSETEVTSSRYWIGAERVAVYSDSGLEFHVQAMDKGLIARYENSSEGVADRQGRPLQEYAEQVWKDNNDYRSPCSDSSFFALATTTVSSRLAYQFNVIDSFNYGKSGDLNLGGYLISEPTTYMFTEYKGIKYEISYPVNSELSKKILQTFKFLP